MDIRIFHCVSVAELYMYSSDKKQILSRESIGIYVRTHLHYIGEGIGSHGRKREIPFKRTLVTEHTYYPACDVIIPVLSNISRHIVHL